MNITNQYNLPKSFVDMATSDYTVAAKEFRVTSLLKGTCETLLERRHAHEITQDVSDMIWLIFGTAAHSVLERSQEQESEIKETRLKIQVGEYTLSGQFDLYNSDTKTVTDYKTCSVWKIIYGDFTDWKRQLLIYAYMLRSIGFEVDKGEIVALMKDHSKRDAKNKAEYPKLPVRKIELRFSEQDFEEIEDFILSRFEEYTEYEYQADEDLPPCTPEQRYNTGDKYAVMKKGRKTALRVLPSKEEADQWMADNGGEFIEERKGEDKKCIDYCSVCEFCHYYQNNVKESAV